MTVKLLSALPKDDKNGLASIESTLADRYYSGGRTTAIVVLESLRVTDEAGERTPAVKVVRIEPVTGENEDAALDLMQDALEQRIGRRPDTLDLSDPGDEFVDVPASPALAIEGDVVDAEIVDEPVTATSGSTS